MRNDDLPYDAENPPAKPPPGAVPQLWTLAYHVDAAHHRLGEGRCACGKPWPCEMGQLARECLRLSCRVREIDHDGSGLPNRGRWQR